MSRKREEPGILNRFWKKLQDLLAADAPTDLGEAFRHALSEQAKAIPIPGVAFFLAFHEKCHEAALRTAANRAPAGAPELYARLRRDLDNATLPDIAAALDNIGIKNEPTRLVLAPMLKSMAKLQAFEKDQEDRTALLQKVLEEMVRTRYQSQWDHNRMLETLWDIQRHIRDDHEFARLELKGIRQGVQVANEQLERIGKDVGIIKSGIEALPGVIIEAQKTHAHATLEAGYLEWIRKEYRNLQLLGIPYGEEDFLAIDPAYVSLSVQDGVADSQPRDVEIVLAAEKALLITGKAGSGKSTLLQWETVQCANPPISERTGRFNRWHGLIPFFLRTRKFDRGEAFPTTDRWVGLSTQRFPLRKSEDVPAWTEQVLKDGRALLIIDGLDEMPEELRPKFWQELRLLAEQYDFAYRVSSRPNPHLQPETDGNKQREELSEAERLQRAWENLQGLARVEVCDLTLEKIDLLIDKWHEAYIKSRPTAELREAIRNTVEGYPGPLKAKLRRQDFRQIRDLIRTPLLCAALCVTNKYKTGGIDSNKADFFKDVCEALLQKRDLRHEVKVDPLYDQLDEKDAFFIHSHVAYEMMINRSYEEEETQYLIEAPVQRVWKWIADISGNIKKAEIKNNLLALRDEAEKMMADGEKDTGTAYRKFHKFLRYLLDRRCLLRETSKGRVDFHHRSLQEYLTASIMMRREELPALLDRADDSRWQDTIRMASGGYYKGSAPEKIIQGLLERGKAKRSRTSILLAASNIRNLEPPIDSDLLDQTLQALKEHVLPLQNETEAHDVAAIGDDVVPLLMESAGLGGKKANRKWRALALLLIGSSEARRALHHHFGGDLGLILDLLQHAPEVNSVELPCVLQHVRSTGALPWRAEHYVYDLAPLAGIPDIESLDLSDCRALINPNFPELKALRLLSLQGCVGIRSLEGLRNLEGLQELSLRGCSNVTSLEPLASLPNLRYLDLSHCPDRLADRIPFHPNQEDADGGLCVEWLDNPEVEARFPLPTTPPPDPLPGDLFQLNLGPCRMTMVWVPPGTFQMGSEEYEREQPVHSVTLRGYWLAKHPVTQAQYEAVTGQNPSNFNGPHRPVECVSWDDATEFARKATAEYGRAVGVTFDLPSEAQWEYACCVRVAGRYCFGDDEGQLDAYAWYAGNSEGQTHPVGLKRPNAWGLHDMHGNVWEWCLDSWHKNYDGAPSDGSARQSKKGSGRVVRGGGWRNDPRDIRSADRDYGSPEFRDFNLGFRLLAVLAGGG